jgi:hypothetical protein
MIDRVLSAIHSFFMLSKKRTMSLTPTFLVGSSCSQVSFWFCLPFFERFGFGQILFGRPDIPQRHLGYVTWTRALKQFDVESVFRIVVANSGSVQIFSEPPPRVARRFFAEDGSRERADSPEALVFIQAFELVFAKPY